MITEDKITEIFCMADDFCKVFDAQMKKYTIQPQNKRKYHREVEHSRHRSVENFVVNTLAALAAYCFFPKKPSIAVERSIDRQLTLC